MSTCNYLKFGAVMVIFSVVRFISELYLKTNNTRTRFNYITVVLIRYLFKPKLLLSPSYGLVQ